MCPPYSCVSMYLTNRRVYSALACYKHIYIFICDLGTIYACAHLQQCFCFSRYIQSSYIVYMSSLFQQVVRTCRWCDCVCVCVVHVSSWLKRTKNKIPWIFILILWRWVEYFSFSLKLRTYAYTYPENIPDSFYRYILVKNMLAGLYNAFWLCVYVCGGIYLNEKYAKI